MTKYWIAVALAMFASPGILPSRASAQSTADVVKLGPAISVDKVRQGSSFQAAVVVNISSGYHVNSNHPSEQYLIPTALKVDKLAGVTTGLVVYPRAGLKKFSFSEKPLSVFEGKVVLKFNASAAASLSVGSHSLHGKLTVQACNDQACLAPKPIEVTIPFEVVDSSVKPNSINGDIFGSSQTRKR